MVIWNLHDNLPVKVIKGTKTVEVKVSALLQYTRTSVDYINLGSTSGNITAHNHQKIDKIICNFRIIRIMGKTVYTIQHRKLKTEEDKHH